jgi:hypothetical protein
MTMTPVPNGADSVLANATLAAIPIAARQATPSAAIPNQRCLRLDWCVISDLLRWLPNCLEDRRAT